MELQKIDEAGLRETVDMAILSLEHDIIPRAAAVGREEAGVLRFDVMFGPLDLHMYLEDASFVHRVLLRLRDETPRALENTDAQSIAAMVVQLDPVEATAAEALFLPGIMQRLRDSRGYKPDGPMAGVRVRGAGRAQAARRLAFLIQQMGLLPAEGERRAA